MLEQQTLDEPPYIYHNDRTQSNQKFVVCGEFLLKNSVKHLQTQMLPNRVCFQS